jgi:hypothetical protein
MVYLSAAAPALLPFLFPGARRIAAGLKGTYFSLSGMALGTKTTWP